MTILYTGGELGTKVANETDLRAKEYVAMGTEDIGCCTSLVGGNCTPFLWLTFLFLFPNAPLLVIRHSRFDMNSP